MNGAAAEMQRRSRYVTTARKNAKVRTRPRAREAPVMGSGVMITRIGPRQTKPEPSQWRKESPGLGACPRTKPPSGARQVIRRLAREGVIRDILAPQNAGRRKRRVAGPSGSPLQESPSLPEKAKLRSRRPWPTRAPSPKKAPRAQGCRKVRRLVRPTDLVRPCPAQARDMGCSFSASAAHGCWSGRVIRTWCDDRRASRLLSWEHCSWPLLPLLPRRARGGLCCRGWRWAASTHRSPQQ